MVQRRGGMIGRLARIEIGERRQLLAVGALALMLVFTGTRVPRI